MEQLVKQIERAGLAIQVAAVELEKGDFTAADTILTLKKCIDTIENLYPQLVDKEPELNKFSS